jgi:hypothetical protein
VGAETTNPSATASLRRTLVLLFLGLALLTAGTIVGVKTDVAPRLRLDLFGGRSDGTIERLPPLGYRISYRHPSGAQWSISPYRGWIGLRRVGEEPVKIVMAYDPEKPSEFQPAGSSSVAGGVVFVLLLAGLTLLLRANRRLRNLLVRPSGSADAARTTDTDH